MRAESTLSDEHNFVAAILETVGALIVVLDTRGRIVKFNRSCEQITGYTYDEVKNKIFWDLLLLPEEIEPVKGVFEKLKAGQFPNEYENYWLTKNKKKRLIHWSNTALVDKKGDVDYVIGTGIDITEQRKAEGRARERQEELAHISRVNTIGEMASGLAHEINQPLSAIINYSQGCLRRMASGEINAGEFRNTIEQIASQSKRAADIIQHLRNFVSKGELQRAPTNINELVMEAIAFVSPEAKKFKVTLQTELAECLPMIDVDAIQIEQIILNLLRDSIDAMNGNKINGRRLNATTTITGQREIEITVSDTGPGIPQEDTENIFAPFFTTKPGGMGLGLTISRTLAEAHGGQLWATPNKDKGITFHLTLPIGLEINE